MPAPLKLLISDYDRVAELVAGKSQARITPERGVSPQCVADRVKRRQENLRRDEAYRLLRERLREGATGFASRWGKLTRQLCALRCRLSSSGRLVVGNRAAIGTNERSCASVSANSRRCRTHPHQTRRRAGWRKRAG